MFRQLESGKKKRDISRECMYLRVNCSRDENWKEKLRIKIKGDLIKGSVLFSVLSKTTDM